MALKLKLTAEEWKGLEEGLKGLYEEKDGTYVLSIDGLEDTSGLKSALEKERKARAEFEKAAKKYEGLGKSPEEITELVKAQEEAEKAKLEQKGEGRSSRPSSLKHHKKELTTRDEAVRK